MTHIPALFLVGAPKCGTTSMYDYLNQHPKICMSKPKEPDYFGKDLRKLESIRQYSSSDDYLQKCFSHCSSGDIIGEASAIYLYSKTAAREIKEFSPNAKIVIMLRNPVEACHSLHSQKLFGGTEEVSDFGKALELIDSRLNGGKLPKYTNIVETFDYIGMYKYYEQVKRYIDVFDKESVHIILFDDLKSDVKSVYLDLLDFLGVNDHFLPDFKPKNTSKSNKSRWINYHLEHPTILSKIIRLLLP